MSDLISRQALCDYALNQKDKSVTPNDIMRFPSAQLEQRWIPCSERLPRDDEEIIVTCLDDSGDTPFSYTTTGWYFKGMWVCNDERCMFVIAWMPLPEPYKGGEKDG